MPSNPATLARDVLAYGGVQLASKLAPILGVFVYAWLMPLDEYGNLTLYFATIWIAGLVVSANMHAGIGRLLFTPGLDSRAVLGTAGIALGSWFVFSGLVWAALRHIVGDLFSLPSNVVVLQVSVGAGLVAESAVTQIMIYQRRSATLLWLVGGRSVAAFGLGLALVLRRSNDLYLGVVYAEALVAVVFIGLVVWLISPSATLTFRTDYVRRLAKYSLPLVAYAASTTLLAQSDRILIAKYVGVEQAGIYGLVYNLAALALLGTIPLLNAFQPRFFDALNNARPEVMQRDAELLVIPALSVAAATVLWGAPLARFVFAERFDDGFTMLPVLALGSLAQVAATIWNRVLAFENRTGFVSLTVVIPLIFNLGANVLLLPRYGYKVAAATTLGSQVVMFLLVLVFLRRLDVARPTLSVRVAGPIAALVAVTVLHLVAGGSFSIWERIMATAVVLGALIPIAVAGRSSYAVARRAPDLL